MSKFRDLSNVAEEAYIGYRVELIEEDAVELTEIFDRLEMVFLRPMDLNLTDKQKLELFRMYVDKLHGAYKTIAKNAFKDGFLSGYTEQVPPDYYE